MSTIHSMTGFGIYIHIPYCLQKCHYCDFTTFDLNHKIKMNEYTENLLSELRHRASSMPQKSLRSIYFGGGTPSLLPTKDILAVLTEIANLGFIRESDCEITIEINPGTVTLEKLDLYLAAGVNRFSVGVQTFRDDYLKASGREHSADDSRKTLRLLSDRKVNYSFDLLFGLPNQSLADLKKDLDELISFSPPHVSLYNLTIPEKHSMNKGRASDEDQAAMFELIENSLAKVGIRRYEVSNFAKVGLEARHNRLYWTSGGYWGVGVSAHSYLPDAGDFGVRFWNPKSASTWQSQALELKEESEFWRHLPAPQTESLALHELLTDFFHTRLRQVVGFSWNDLDRLLSRDAISEETRTKIRTGADNRVASLVGRGLLQVEDNRVFMTQKGYPLANSVFLGLTFSIDEV